MIYDKLRQYTYLPYNLFHHYKKEKFFKKSLKKIYIKRLRFMFEKYDDHDYTYYKNISEYLKML